MEDDAPKTGGTAGGPHGAGEAPYESGYSGSPEAADDSHGQIKTDQHTRTESGFAENAEPLFLISMLPSIMIPLIGTVLFR